MLKYISNYLTMMVIVFIGWGWTLIFMDLNEFDDLFLPIFIFLGILQLII